MFQYIDENKILRLGQQGSVKKNVQHLTLEAKLSKCTNTDRISLIQHILEETVKFFFSGANKHFILMLVPQIKISLKFQSSVKSNSKFQPIVACTCLGMSTNLLFSYRRFSMTVVDEASLVLEPTIIPAIAASDSFVLVGDHRQLNPLVCSKQSR